MNYEKAIVPVSVCVAAVVVAVAAVLVTGNWSATARAKQAEAESLEIAADKQAKEARLNKDAAVARSAAAAADRDKAKAEREKAADERARAESDARAAEESAKRAALEAEAARASAEAASALKAAEKAKADAARSELDRENARIQGELAISNAAAAEAAARLETEKRKSDAIIAEATALELRKVDFESLRRDLLEYKQELDERERALHPDVSIYDSSNVTWVAEREADVIGGDTNLLLRTSKVAPEEDPRLPKESRELARADRLFYESCTNRAEASRAKVVGRLERLRDEAARAGRVVDAEFYQKSIRSLYPDYQKK